MKIIKATIGCKPYKTIVIFNQLIDVVIADAVNRIGLVSIIGKAVVLFIKQQ